MEQTVYNDVAGFFARGQNSYAPLIKWKQGFLGYLVYTPIISFATSDGKVKVIEHTALPLQLNLMWQFVQGNMMPAQWKFTTQVCLQA